MSETYHKELDGWEISWEVNGHHYRRWCIQRHSNTSEPVAVVMQNPGSLYGSGEGLAKDLTLRILRKTFANTGLHPFCVNLFDLVSPKPEFLLANWEKRDIHPLIYESLTISQFKGVLFAYGDMDILERYRMDVEDRIACIQKHFKNLTEIKPIKTKKGNPAHPRLWQTTRKIPEISSKLTQFAKIGRSGNRITNRDLA